MTLSNDSSSLVDELVEKLEVMIFRGEFPPGARIREARLAGELGVGPGPMREALRRLEGRRIVVRHPNFGTSVARLSAEELLELIQVREALEVGACRLAVENMTQAGEDKLRSILERQIERQAEAKSTKLPHFFGEWHNYDFHYQIALLSGNRRLIELLTGDIWILLRAYRFPGAASLGRLPNGYAGHEAILNAMVARDVDASERLMREHIREFRDLTIKRLTDAVSVSEKGKKSIKS